MLYDNQDKLEDTDLENLAKALGLDAKRIMKAIATKKHAARIQRDQDLAAEIQAAGTPHFFLNGRRLAGAQPREKFETLIDEEISIGDYVLTNGTLAAAVVIDALARFIPGVLGEEKSLTTESFTRNLLDFPQYTRPAVFRGMSVPEVLQQGHHGEIEKWRHARQLEKTRQGRPDLLTKQP